MKSASILGVARDYEAVQGSDDAEVEHKVDTHKLYSKLNWRLLPLFFLMVVINYVDRTNLAFAAIQLNESLGFTPRIYGLGSGMFFLGYATLQIPSNLLLKRFGGRAWLSIIIAAWGVCAVAMSLMTSHIHFYVLRLLLGVAEAGAFPGMWYTLSRWYPGDRITMPFAVVETGIALSHTVAAPLAAACLSLDNLGGLEGWQWLFILEGIPSMALAVAFYMLLPGSPEQASFLTDAEKRYLVAKLASSSKGAPPGGPTGSGSTAAASGSTREALMCAARNHYVWYLGVMKMVKDVAGFGIIFWTPTIVNAIIHGKAVNLDAEGTVPSGEGHSAGHGDTGATAALLTSLPFALAAGFGFYVAHRSQRENERVMHIAVPAMISGLVFIWFPMMVKHSSMAGFFALTVGVMGVYSGNAPLLSLLSEVAAGPGLVVALPLYNSLGNIGGFVGPYMVGALVEKLRSFGLPSVVMGVCLSVSGFMAALMTVVFNVPVGKGKGPGLTASKQ